MVCLTCSYFFLSSYKSSDLLNPLTARIFTVFGQSLLGDRELYKGERVVTLLGIHLRFQGHKKVKFSGRDISSLAVRGLRTRLDGY